MSIVFNNIPTTIRTPGTYVEIDSSRALSGLIENPHRVLILGQKIGAGTADVDVLMNISRDSLAVGLFGPGSIIARMCNKFKDNNPNTEVHAMALGSGIAGAAASTEIDISGAMYSDVVSANGTWYIMINGIDVNVPITSGMGDASIAATLIAVINSNSNLPVVAAADGVSAGVVVISAVNSGTLGNYIDIRENYYDYQRIPLHFVSGSVGPLTVGSFAANARSFTSVMLGGSIDPDLGDAWAVIDNEQFHYIIQPYTTTVNLTEIEDELTDRFLPLTDLQGHGFTAVRATLASCTTLGNARNNAHNTIVGVNNSPTGSEEWAAAWGAVAAWNLNIDPARPLHTLQLKGILPPIIEDRFTREERDTLLYDGIATWIISGGKVLIERSATTYQTNALGLLDPTFLDVQTVATLSEIRFQYKQRMSNRFIDERFKLADNSFPVQPGSKVVRPKDIREESIALFTSLRDRGLIEDLDDFVDNIVVERDPVDRSRVNVLLPANLIDQFRVLAAQIQFLL